MKFDGEVYDMEQNGQVREAIIGDNRIALTYTFDDERWSLVATRKDELVYRGDLGSGIPNPECTVELGVYTSEAGAVILFGKWFSRVTGETEPIVFRLFPKKEPRIPATKLAKPARKRK